MPLNQDAGKFKLKIAQTVRNVVANAVGFLKPDVYFGFFIVAIFLSLFLKTSIGFYILCAVFIVLYFTERIIKITNKPK